VVAKHDVDSPLTRYRIPVRPSRVDTTTGAVTDHQPRRQQVLLRGPFGLLDPLEHALRGEGSDAGAVGVDRGQRHLADRGDEGVVVAGDRDVAWHPETGVATADIAPTAARSFTAAMAVIARPPRSRRAAPR
jgi:hypothetical protein